MVAAWTGTRSPRAKGTIKVRDEVMVRATVTAVWKDGHITVHIISVGQKVTLPNKSHIVVANSAPARPKGKAKKAALASGGN